MKKVYSTKSWHYRLATVYGGMTDFFPASDICEYLHFCIRGALFAVILSLALSYVGYIMVVNPVLWVYASMQCDWKLATDNIIDAAILSWSIVGGSLVCIGLLNFGSISTKIKSVFNNSFIGDAVNSIYNKMCFTIQFKDDK